MLNPNQGFKKIVQKLKTRYKVGDTHAFSLPFLHAIKSNQQFE